MALIYTTAFASLFQVYAVFVGPCTYRQVSISSKPQPSVFRQKACLPGLNLPSLLTELQLLAFNEGALWQDESGLFLTS